MKRNGSLNHIYRLVWSHASNAWVAVAESTKGRGKGKNSRRKLIAAALSLTAMTFSLPPAMAGPTGGKVVSGSASIHHHGTTTEIDQTSTNVSLNWNSFNIAATETVDFVQPSAMSVAVNHILDNSGSQILGHLNANGQVFLINPNGIIFGAGAQVNVGGLVASTLDFNDASLAGNSRSFSGNGTGSIVNQGTITAKGGYVALVGNSVTNQGTIKAQLGTVALAAGSAVTLTFSGNELLHLQVDQSTLNTLAANGSLIQADGGTVIMTAGAKNSLLASVVNNSGTIEAQTVQNQPGNITLLGGMVTGSMNLQGSLDASAPNGGNGGAIETSAANVHIANNAHVTTAASTGHTGSWLIDPADFTIAQSGGDATGQTVSTALATTNIIVLSSNGGNPNTGSGNVYVNDLVTWTANTLVLNAANNILINSPMTGSGSAKLTLMYGQNNAGTSSYSINAPVTLPSGMNFSTQVGTNNLPVVYNVINTLGAQGSVTGMDLQGINGNLSGNFALGSAIVASATANWGSTGGFTPIGNATTPFTGNFDGLGNSISGLTINTPSNNNVGLFGYVSGSHTTSSANGNFKVNAAVQPPPEAGLISNVALVGATISAQNNVGGLVGYSSGGSISNVSVTGNVSGNTLVGGVVGQNSGLINNSQAGVTVYGAASVGGLVGTNYGTISGSSVSSAQYGAAAINVNSANGGGLVGINKGLISSSGVSNVPIYTSNGNVGNIGGLVGSNSGTISGSSVVIQAGNYAFYDSGSISGGLVGYNSGTILSSQVTGNGKVLSGQSILGGLVGLNSGTIKNSSTVLETVLGQGNVGGLVGFNAVGGVVTDSSSSSGVFAGQNNGGGLVGSNAGTINGSSASGQVSGLVNFTSAPGSPPGLSGSSNLGGLVGSNALTGIIQNDNSGPSSASGTVFGFANIGGLVGTNYGGTIRGAVASASALAALNNAGGLVGVNLSGTISGSSASGNSNGFSHSGGLVGLNTGTISQSFASGAVSGNNYVGGLVGINSGTITQSYATGPVSAATYAGGLVGINAGAIALSFATGNVTGQRYIGGLVGDNGQSLSIQPSVPNPFSISNSYASGATTGSNFTAGLVGFNDTNGQITNTYASGVVHPGTSNAALVGVNGGAVTTSFWNTDINPGMVGVINGPGTYTPTIGTIDTLSAGLTNAQMMQASSFANAGWAINGNSNPYVWRIYNGNTTPLLEAYLAPATIVTNSTPTVSTYSGQVQTGGLTLANVTCTSNGSACASSQVLSSSVYGNAINAGTYQFGQGIYSTQFGYDFAYAGPALIINKAPLTYVANSTSRVYGQANPVLLGTLGGLVGSDTLANVVSGTLLFSTPALITSNVTTYPENGYGLTVNNSNYQSSITQANSNITAFSITPALLSYVATATSKVYGQANPPLFGTLSGLVNGDIDAGVVSGSAVFSTTATTNSNVGIYPETGTGVKVINVNYQSAIAQDPGNSSAFTITPATLTYNAFPNFKVYGQTNPGLWGFVSGFVNGDTLASATTGKALFTSNATASSNVGFYGITGSGLTADNGNYVFQQASWNPYSLFIIPAILTYNANSATKTYGQANPIFGGSVSGFVNADTLANATTGTLAFSSYASSGSNVGKYAVMGSGLTADNSNYLFVQAGSNRSDLTVTPATLTYLATAETEHTKSKPKGLTGKITGYVLGQGSSVLNGSVMWTTTATASSLAGNYSILGSGLSAQNYIFAQAGTNAAALTLVNAPGTHQSAVAYSPSPKAATQTSQLIAGLPDMANAGKRGDTADVVLNVDVDTTRTEYAHNASADGQLFQVVNGGIRMSASLK